MKMEQDQQISAPLSEAISADGEAPDADEPGAPATSRRSRPRRLGRLAGWCVLGMSIVFSVANFFITMPYAVMGPGDAKPVSGLISAPEDRRFDAAGEVFFLTVRLDTTVRPIEYMYAKTQSDTEILDRKFILGGNTPKEDDRINAEAMTDSKLTASVIALTELGYDVEFHGEGARVVAVGEDMPAAGLLEPGDIITSVDGHSIELADELGPLVRRHKAGEEVDLSVRRGDEVLAIAVVTELAPPTNGEPSPERVIIGVEAVTANPDVELPFNIEIDTDDVGGPSAGLAFTLALLENLSPGELLGGFKVAVTGTINADGTVGDVGGVAQKASVARSAGAKLMITPSTEEAEARKHAGSMKVIGVDNITEALAALESIGGDPLPAHNIDS